VVAADTAIRVTQAMVLCMAGGTALEGVEVFEEASAGAAASGEGLDGEGPIPLPEARMDRPTTPLMP